MGEVKRSNDLSPFHQSQVGQEGVLAGGGRGRLAGGGGGGRGEGGGGVEEGDGPPFGAGVRVECEAAVGEQGGEGDQVGRRLHLLLLFLRDLQGGGGGGGREEGGGATAGGPGRGLRCPQGERQGDRLQRPGRRQGRKGAGGVTPPNCSSSSTQAVLLLCPSLHHLALRCLLVLEVRSGGGGLLLLLLEEAELEVVVGGIGGVAGTML